MKLSPLDQYLESYYAQLENLESFYDKLDWDELKRIAREPDLETIKATVDSFFDDCVFRSCLIGQTVPSFLDLVGLWGAKAKAMTLEAQTALAALALDPILTPPPSPDLEKSSRAFTNQGSVSASTIHTAGNRFSLDLIKGSVGSDARLKRATAPTTTTVNVIANSTFMRGDVPPDTPQPQKRHLEPTKTAAVQATEPTGAPRRRSSVDDKLPLYIRQQLQDSSRLERSMSHTALQKLLVIGLDSLASSNASQLMQETVLQENFLINSESLLAFANNSTNLLDLPIELRVMDLRVTERVYSSTDTRDSLSTGGLASTYSLHLGDSHGAPSSSGFAGI